MYNSLAIEIKRPILKVGRSLINKTKINMIKFPLECVLLDHKADTFTKSPTESFPYANVLVRADDVTVKLKVSVKEAGDLSKWVGKKVTLLLGLTGDAKYDAKLRVIGVDA